MTPEQQAVYEAVLQKLETEKKTAHYFSVDSTDKDANSNYNNDGATGLNAIAIGRGATAQNESSIALGWAARAIDTNAIAVGYASYAEMNHSMALGSNANAKASYSTALGYCAETGGGYSMALGGRAEAAGESSMALGWAASAYGNQSQAAGYNAWSTGDYSQSSGYNAVAAAEKGIDEATYNALSDEEKQNYMLNYQSEGNKYTSLYYRMKFKEYTEDEFNALSVMERHILESENGYRYDGEKEVWRRSPGAVAIGHAAKAIGLSTLAVGDLAEATGKHAVAVGRETEATDVGNTALGYYAKAKGAQATALGSGAQALGDGSVALGKGSVADREPGKVGYIALGGSATFEEALVTLGKKTDYDNWTATINASKAEYERLTDAYFKASASDKPAAKAALDTWKKQHKDFVDALEARARLETTWKANKGAVSVGRDSLDDAGNRVIETRQITNVAAGTEDTDAVNVAQLKALNTKVDKGAAHYFSVKSDDSANPAGTNWNNDGATGWDAIAIGHRAQAEGYQSTALGAFAIAQGEFSTALGGLAQVRGKLSTALGFMAQAEEDYSTALGSYANAKASYSTALGYYAEAEGDSSTALGNGAKARSQESVAIGSGSVADREAGKVGYIALGGSATFEEALVTLNKKKDYDNWTATINASKAEYDRLTKAYFDAIGSDKAAAKTALDAWKGQHQDFVKALEAKSQLEATWKANKGAVSVGRDSLDEAGNRRIESRQITNVAAGSEDTDAVNVAQLKVVNTKVDKNTTNITNLNTKVEQNTNKITTIEQNITNLNANAGKGSMHYFSVKSDDSANPDGTNWNNDGATGQNAIAIGRNSTATDKNGVSVGPNNKNEGARTTLIGSDNVAYKEAHRTTAVGYKNSLMSENAFFAGGEGNVVYNGVAIGVYNNAMAENAVAIGGFSSARRAHTVAIGNVASALADGAVAIGDYAEGSASYGTALGGEAKVKKNAGGGVALGYKSVADRNGGVLGYVPGAETQTVEGIAKYLGKEKEYEEWKKDRAANEGIFEKYRAFYKAAELDDVAESELAEALINYAKSPTEANKKKVEEKRAAEKVTTEEKMAVYNTITADEHKTLKDLRARYGQIFGKYDSRMGAVSVGDKEKGITRQIINVAAGSEDTDAVNVFQLKGVNAKVDKNTENITKNTTNITNLNTKVEKNTTDITNLTTNVTNLTTKVDKGSTHYFSVNSDDKDKPAGTNWNNDGATGNDAVAAGRYAKAYGNQSQATGRNAWSIGGYSQASGYNAVATAEKGIDAATYNALSAGEKENYTLNQQSEGKRDTSLYYRTTFKEYTKDEFNALPVMERHILESEQGYTFDKEKQVWTRSPGAVAIGHAAKAIGLSTLAVGDSAEATGKYAVAVGRETEAADVGTTAAGYYAKAKGLRSTALGIATLATEYESTAVGPYARAEGKVSLALGSKANAKGNNSIAMGLRSESIGESSIALGGKAKTQAQGSVAIGMMAESRQKGSVALGEVSLADREAGVWGLDISTGQAMNEDALLGAGKADYDAAKAKLTELQGQAQTLRNEYETSLAKDPVAPNGNHIPSADTQAIGNKLRAKENEVSTQAIKVNDFVKAWKATTGAVSVGNTGLAATRQITNVAAGTEDTDAVNVAQLKGVNAKVDKNTENITKNTTNITNLTTKVDTNTTNITNLSTKVDNNTTNITNLNTKVDKNTTDITNLTTNVTNLKTQVTNGSTHYFSVNSDDKNKPVGTNWNNDGATGEHAIAVGKDAEATDVGNTAVGYYSKATGLRASAFGIATQAREIESTAVGAYAWAEGSLSSAFGAKAHAKGVAAVAIGHVAKATGKTSIALGGKTKAQADGSVAIGTGAEAGITSSVALGEGAVADREAGEVGYIALGGSATFEEVLVSLNKKEDYDKWTVTVNASKAEYEKLKEAYFDAYYRGDRAGAATAKAALDEWKGQHKDFVEAMVAKLKLETTWKSNKGAVSVGREVTNVAGERTIETRQITNVAAGTRDTDAVNVAQLRNVVTAPMNFYFGGKKENNIYVPGNTNWSMPMNEFRMDFGDGLKAEEVEKDGKKYTLVTIDKDSLKDDPAFKGEKGDKGDPGLNGKDGRDGVDGKDGRDGKSAYDIWKEQPGNGGKTPEDFVDSMKGKGGTTVEAGENISVKTESDKAIVSLNKDISVDSVKVGGVSIDSKGINAGEKQITGVAAGTKPTDAVNVAQLALVDKQVTSNMVQINSLRDESREGDAMGAAMAALKPLDYDPYQRSQIMAGVSHYRGKEAVALGVAYYKSEDLMLHGGLAYGGSSDIMVNAGVSYRFGSSSAKRARDQRMPQYAEGPVTSVYILQDEVARLKQENEEAREEIRNADRRVEEMRRETEAVRREANEKIAALEAKLQEVLEKMK